MKDKLIGKYVYLIYKREGDVLIKITDIDRVRYHPKIGFEGMVIWVNNNYTGAPIEVGQEYSWWNLYDVCIIDSSLERLLEKVLVEKL